MHDVISALAEAYPNSDYRAALQRLGRPDRRYH
jgi:limonene-1,2-epoxide hydrolase